MQSFFTGDIIDVFSWVIFVRIWRLEEGDKKSRTKKCWSARSSEAAAFIGHSPGTCLPFDLMRNKEWKGLKLKSFITIIFSTSYLFRTTQIPGILRFLQAIAEKNPLDFFHNLAPDNLAPRQFGTNIVAYYPSRPLLTLVAKLSYNLFDKILKSLSMID